MGRQKVGRGGDGLKEAKKKIRFCRKIGWVIGDKKEGTTRLKQTMQFHNKVRVEEVTFFKTLFGRWRRE